MYKLTVVDGPSRGSSFNLNEGELSIGRMSTNQVVLSSSRVSKRHCVLVVSNGQVVMRDQGSSNGTFVNGVVAQSRNLTPGDRIGVGEFVLELTQIKSARLLPPVNNVVPMISKIEEPTQAAPTDLKGRILFAFEHKFMPIFYQLNLKHEWKLMAIGLFAAFILINLVISVHPLIESGKLGVKKESLKRAKLIAKQIVDRNSSVIAAKMETKADIGSLDREDGVRVAVLVDTDGRVLAPSSRFNQYLSVGPEANYFARVKALYQKGHEDTMFAANDGLMIVIEPLKILNPQYGKNVVSALAVVSLDMSITLPDMGEIGVTYSETLAMTAIIAAIFLIILYRITLKPLEVLNEDLDKVLKGDIAQITREFKFPELDPLYDLINSTAQRVSRMGGGGGNTTEAVGPSIDEYVAPLRSIGDQLGKGGLIILNSEKRVVYMSTGFEEISGIRSDGAIGQELSVSARDQAFTALAQDLFDRVQPGSDALVEDFEFSGVSVKVGMAAFGSPGSPRCYALTVAKADG